MVYSGFLFLTWLSGSSSSPLSFFLVFVFWIIFTESGMYVWLVQVFYFSVFRDSVWSHGPIVYSEHYMQVQGYWPLRAWEEQSWSPAGVEHCSRRKCLQPLFLSGELDVFPPQDGQARSYQQRDYTENGSPDAIHCIRAPDMDTELEVLGLLQVDRRGKSGKKKRGWLCLWLIWCSPGHH